METLLGYGADLHVRGGKLRETPLHIASRVKDGERCALMLLKSGAGPNLTTDDGQTPVHVASKNGNLQTLMLLLDEGGDAMYKSNVSEKSCILNAYLVSFHVENLVFIISSPEKLHFTWLVGPASRKLSNN